MTDQANNQPPAGYIWPQGFYPIYREHDLNLLAAEKYVQQQKDNEYWSRWRREHPWNWRTEWRTNLLAIALLIVVSLFAMLFM